MPAVILVEPFDPVNVAATARVMASFRAGPLIIVRPRFGYEHLDPAIARGGTALLDALETSERLDALRERYTLIATSGKPSSGSHTRTYLTPFELRERGTDENTALVFGSETDGLSVADLETCDLVVSIETSSEQRALNLSHAVAVVLAITSRIDDPVQRRHPPSDRTSRDALLGAVERLYTMSAHEINAYRAERLRTLLRVWNRMIARTDASKQEIRTLFGLINQCERAFEQMNEKTPRITSDPGASEPPRSPRSR